MIEAIPEAIQNAIELGIGAVLLALLSQFPRLAWVWWMGLAALVAYAVRLDVLNTHWALGSAIHDAPWGVALPLVVVAAGAVVAAPRLAGSLPGRMILLALVPPVAAGHRTMRAVWERHLPDPRERAGLVLLVNGLGALVPFFGTAALGLTWAGAAGTPPPHGVEMLVNRLFHPTSAPPALAAVAVGALAWWLGGKSAAATPAAPPDPKGSPLLPLLLTAPFTAVIVWVAIASGVLEFAAQGIEQAPIFLPRVTEAVFALGAVLLGGVLDEATLAVGFHEVLARAFSLYDDTVRDTLLVGFSVGSGLPMLIATRSGLRFGLPFWFVQVAAVVGWYLLAAR